MCWGAEIATLDRAGYVAVRKTGPAGRNRRMHVRLSDQGRHAFDAHVAALNAMLTGAGTVDDHAAQQD